MNGPFKRSGGTSPGDDERFREIYEDTSADLFAFLLRRCRTAEDAADCLAETYTIAWEKRERIPAGSEGRPWLFGVARNVARRDRSRNHTRTATTEQLVLAARAPSTSTTSQNDKVTAALDRLSALERDIVLMLTAGGLTPREVASVLALSPNTVRVRAHRAREKLRRLLADEATENDVGPRLEPTPALSVPRTSP